MCFALLRLRQEAKMIIRCLCKDPDKKRSQMIAPLIVAWTPFFTTTIKQRISPKLMNCRYQCEFIDRKQYEISNRDADAYVLHGRDIIFYDLPRQTSPHLNILLLLEPPTLAGPQISQLTRIVKRKKRGSLILVSRCITPSKREDVIRELGQYTEITVGGKCKKAMVTNKSLPSLPPCPGCSDNELIGEFSKATHRFYISFENSLCNEYITEKFFRRASEWLVPVVRKRAFYEGTSIPSDSFIALDDFENTQELGNYLNFLRRNDTEYKKYFQWRRHYRDPWGYRSDALCKLCEDIYNGTELVITNIKEYYEKKQCISVH
ncbi:fucosyl transferase [Oesophagostomum dentatum]|uniref:Fucosyltransferase n=1 Tax=Oesophagostomum dentatum TaxID=61180 RepID=A0A0B1TEY4_OESDE|nr:fucosyl transferase [Oesophagostomum dentatum]